ncbi:MAG: cephalosporin hydroxylase [Chloroflexota bacterium]|nr:MAG: cephalosporin hydroxylase [Chloroflexota bacterium]
MNTTWMGTRIYKSPFDMWVYQEILFEKRPDLVIETGTAFGGSALYLAHLMDILNHGEIVTIDVVANPVPVHPRITYINGSSTDQAIVDLVKGRCENKSVMVILDSEHTMRHVLDELTVYSQVVTPNQYLIVEDTNINGHPVHKRFGPGPWEAVQGFRAEHSQFQIDKSREKFLMSFNPGGFLLKSTE